MLIDILAYRQWAQHIAYALQHRREFDNHKICLHESIEGHHKDATLTFLVGWSDIVPAGFYKYRNVLVLHPSPLPRYRGGSPIQNQIIAGETESAVTLFKLDPRYPEVDSGPIYAQWQYSLLGELDEILEHISDAGEIIIAKAISEFTRTGKLDLTFQDQDLATIFPRRHPEQSEITTEELATLTAEQLYNKIRALQDPYPNAFIKVGDGSKLYITKAHI